MSTEPQAEGEKGLPLSSPEAHLARPLRVAHVITELGAGGAEAMLFKLVMATRTRGLRHSVVAITDGVLYGDKLAANGIPVTYLGVRQGVPDPRALVALVRQLRRDRPDVVQGWMYHANLLAGIASAAAGRIPVVWGIHHSYIDPATTRWLSRWTVATCARLSARLPARIVCCANSALRSHAAMGYSADRMVVIPNGFPVEQFCASPTARARIRRELAVPEDAPVVGLVARFHPDKDFPNFLAAACLVTRAMPGAVFAVAGEGADASNPILARWIDDSGIRPRLRLLGHRSDVPDVLSALDVLASSSRTEGFPQVLGEAMLCRVPCAATDCGDSRDIIGPTGRVVPPSNPTELARAILELLNLTPSERAEVGVAARRRVVANYDIRVAACRYAALYADVAGRFKV
jgi:glycosyltransferase involved in cell wall biosynthesis